MRLIALTMALGSLVSSPVLADESNKWLLESKEIQEALDAHAIDETLRKYDKRIEEKPIWPHFLDNLQFSVEGSYTNSDNLLTGPGNATNVPREFDSEKGVGNVSFGWVDRKVIRDAVFRLGFDEQDRRSYLEGNWLRWAVLDAITAKAVVGYGTTLNDAEGTQNSKTSNEFLFTVGAKYTLPLDRGSWRNPLNK